MWVKISFERKKVGNSRAILYPIKSFSQTFISGLTQLVLLEIKFRGQESNLSLIFKNNGFLGRHSCLFTCIFFSIMFNYPKKIIRSTLSNNIFRVKQKTSKLQQRSRNFNFRFFFSYFTSENNLEINVLSSFGCPNNHNPHSTLLDLFRY